MLHEAWALESLDGLGSLREVGGPINITDCHFLPTCEVCGLLEQVALTEDDAICSGNLADNCGDDTLYCD